MDIFPTIQVDDIARVTELDSDSHEMSTVSGGEMKISLPNYLNGEKPVSIRKINRRRTSASVTLIPQEESKEYHTTLKRNKKFKYQEKEERQGLGEQNVNFSGA